MLNNVARFLLSISLGNIRRVFSVNKAIFFYRSDWNLDNLVVVATDDRFLSDDVRNAIANRVFNLFAMTMSIASAPIGALR